MGRMLRCLLILAAALLAGCTSRIVPLRPVQQVETWVPDAAATQPAETQAAATEPATQPGRIVLKTVDPNETARYIYNANYDNVWRQAIAVLNASGFELDRQDYRLGVLTTRSLPSAQMIQFWKPDHTNPTSAMENTINNQRRRARVSIYTVEGKPEFYQIAIQVIVERQTNPTEEIGGPILTAGSGFGRNRITLRSDYISSDTDAGRWNIIGHDPDLETKLLDALFQRI
jgi:hypothetical protein